MEEQCTITSASKYNNWWTIDSQTIDSQKMSFPNIPTPPSSSEDSSPLYFVPSPNSAYFAMDTAPSSTNLQMSSPPNLQTSTVTNMTLSDRPAYLKIIEQPTDKFRFRYKSEMAGTHGSLNGRTSDKTRKQTYPTVELRNFKDKAIVRCSIYQINKEGMDMKPHAHRLIKKLGKEEVDDPHQIDLSPDTGYTAIFHSMGIIHTAKKQIVHELNKKKTDLKLEMVARAEGRPRQLNKKEEMQIRQDSESELKTINLNIVCLRFDAFVQTNGILYPICSPVFSTAINNLKSALTGELKIVRMDHCSSPAKGNREIFLLVERVTKKNVKIRFFELDDEDQEVWEDYGKFSELDVHHQYAIVFKTPPYKDQNIDKTIKVFIELIRPSDRATSEPKEFTYTCSNDYKPGLKRSRTNDSSNSTSLDSSEYNLQLPEMITSLNNIKTNNSWDNPIFDNSLELEKAMKDVDSDEFKQLFLQYDKNLIEDHFVSSDLQIDCSDSTKNNTNTNNSIIVHTIGKLQLDCCYNILKDIKNHLKSKPSKQRISNLLKHYLTNSELMPTLILTNDLYNTLFIVNLINLNCPKSDNLINCTNRTDLDNFLHLSIRCNNVQLVQTLIASKCDLNHCNSSGQTCINLACSIDNINAKIVQLLAENGSNLDVPNSDGHCPINCAIDLKRLDLLHILVKYGANVNVKHTKSGFTPLRFCIDLHFVEGLQFLLSLPNLDCLIEDFNGVSALQCALLEDSPKDIQLLVQQFVDKHKIQVSVKLEQLSDCEEQMDIDVQTAVKLEPNLLEQELEIMYTKVARLSLKDLSAIARHLDQSGSGQDLSELLELNHLWTSNVFRNSLELLNYAVDKNRDSLWDIRCFVQALGDSQGVDLMDSMVRLQYGLI